MKKRPAPRGTGRSMIDPERYKSRKVSVIQSLTEGISTREL